MVMPGEFSLDLFLSPEIYLAVTIFGSIILCMLSAYLADRFADEAAKEAALKENPSVDTKNIWVLENGDFLSLVAGLLTAIVVVLPLLNTIEAVGGLFGVFSISVLSGWGARKILPSLSNAFIERRVGELK